MENFLTFYNLSYPVLSLVIFMPLAGAFCLFLIKNDRAAKYWALFITLINALISISLYTGFDSLSYKFQFAELHSWIPAYDINYVIGVDGISLLMVLLTTFIMPLCVLCSWKYIDNRIKEFLFCLLLMETAMIGVFAALDFVLFYVFWEFMLIPMYLLIAIWGGPNKKYASIKFFIYTLAGSVLLLVALIALYVTSGTFFIPGLMGQPYSFVFQVWVFLAFALAFAIKVPMFPFHTWLPAAHVEAPTAGSVVLASVLLKMGAYGFLRFCLPITPQASLYFMPFLLGLSIISIIYGGYVALGQNDMKKLIAYSSVGHMGFVTLGIFVLNFRGIEGAILQMLNHGITTGALFICVGIIYERTHSRDIADNSALVKIMPLYVTFFGIFSLSALAFPGTNSFVGEILVLIGAFTHSNWTGALAIPGAILAAAYMLRLLQKIIWADQPGHHAHQEHGADPHEEGDKRHLWDLDAREFFILAFLTIFVFFIGFHPGPFLEVMNASISHLVEQLHCCATL